MDAKIEKAKERVEELNDALKKLEGQPTRHDTRQLIREFKMEKKEQEAEILRLETLTEEEFEEEKKKAKAESLKVYTLDNTPLDDYPGLKELLKKSKKIHDWCIFEGSCAPYLGNRGQNAEPIPPTTSQRTKQNQYKFYKYYYINGPKKLVQKYWHGAYQAFGGKRKKRKTRKRKKSSRKRIKRKSKRKRTFKKSSRKRIKTKKIKTKKNK